MLAKGILCHGYSDYMSHIPPLKGYKVLLMVLVVNCFVFLKKTNCFVVTIFDLVHDVEAIFHLP